ncbi:TIGR03862 family flavoprotein [Uliginosibacterium sediminicola]|uniref:TIGR03862 family flavoprotein n=1 Tax=Uliginosibacterium sediminicola TaxID=2024550 RepID=A0ABU9YTW6_9RHOO
MTHPPARIAVIGGGPAGLMAAEVLASAGHAVEVFDAMPSLGRKFLMAGKGGMNITHSEATEAFIARYAERSARLAPMLQRFGPGALRDWIHGLGIETFIGSSGRVFPTDMKAAPLLRAWLHRLREQGVKFHVRHRWNGGLEPTAQGQRALRFLSPSGEISFVADAVVLALGGGSWQRLGSDGAWVPWLAARGVAISPLRPANCGFNVAWSAHLRTRHAGEALKAVMARCVDTSGLTYSRQGDCVISDYGIEGGLIYSLSAVLRESIAEQGQATLSLDLQPDRDLAWLSREIAHPRGARSLSSHLHSRIGLHGLKATLLRECLAPEVFQDPARLAAGIKALPISLLSARPLDEAISSAGGVRFESLDEGLMLSPLPGVFCAGEMLDWEAPTGGYLLTACFASGHTAGHGALAYLQQR